MNDVSEEMKKCGKAVRSRNVRLWPILFLALSGPALFLIGWGVGYRLPLWQLLSNLAIGIGLVQVGTIVYCVWRTLTTRFSDREVLTLLIAAALLYCTIVLKPFLRGYSRGQVALLKEVTPNQIADECLDLISYAQCTPGMRQYGSVDPQVLMRYPSLVRLRADVQLISQRDELAVVMSSAGSRYWFGLGPGYREWVLMAPSPDGLRTILRRPRAVQESSPRDQATATRQEEVDRESTTRGFRNGPRDPDEAIVRISDELSTTKRVECRLAGPQKGVRLNYHGPQANVTNHLDTFFDPWVEQT